MLRELVELPRLVELRLSNKPIKVRQLWNLAEEGKQVAALQRIRMPVEQLRLLLGTDTARLIQATPPNKVSLAHRLDFQKL